MTSPSERETGGSAGLEAPPAEFATLPAGIGGVLLHRLHHRRTRRHRGGAETDPAIEFRRTLGRVNMLAADLCDFCDGRPWGQTQEARFHLVRGTPLIRGAIWGESEPFLFFGGKYLRFSPA